MASDDTGGYGRPGGFDGPDLLTQLGRRLQRRPSLIAWIIWGLVALVVLGWALATMFYTVDVQERAVVLRFGRHLERLGMVDSGLHVKLPFGIDQVLKAKVRQVKKEEFGYQTIRPGVKSEFRVLSSLMLTADRNVVNVRWVVQYKIDDLPDYLFNLRDVRVAVRDVSSAIMRRVVGDHSVDEVLTVSRRAVRTRVQEEIQAKLDEYGAGVRVIAVRLRDTTPPEEVRDAFNEVNRALQKKQELIQEAEGERNRQIPAARGEKEQMILEAEGYKIEKINRAVGDTAEFEAVLEKYLAARDITRQRLYLETMETILPAAGKKYIIEKDTGALKLLPLEAFGAKGGGR